MQRLYTSNIPHFFFADFGPEQVEGRFEAAATDSNWPPSEVVRPPIQATWPFDHNKKTEDKHTLPETNSSTLKMGAPWKFGDSELGNHNF